MSRKVREFDHDWRLANLCISRDAPVLSSCHKGGDTDFAFFILHFIHRLLTVIVCVQV